MSNQEETLPDLSADADFHGQGGGAGNNGNMPRTNLNNPFSGHVVSSLLDNMPAPTLLTYRAVWTAVKAQHPIMGLFVDVADTQPNNRVQLTVTKVEIYGSSSGIITMQPFVQVVAEEVNLTTSVGAQSRPVGQQLFDVGTFNSKPMLVHNFGDNVANTRYVNVGVQDPTNRNLDTLVQFQQIQRSATPVPVDIGYIRVSFILRQTVFVNMGTALLTFEDYAQEDIEKKMQNKIRKRCHEVDQVLKINRVKALTLPTLDSK